MPRTFADSLSADVAAFLNANEFAQPVTYLEDDGVDTPVAAAMVYDEQVREEDGESGREQITWREVEISRSDVPNPRLDAKVKVDATEVVYSVQEIVAQDDNLSRLRVIRVESIERSRPGYRSRGYR